MIKNALSQRLAEVQRQIAEAARIANRDPAGVTIIGVTKTLPAELVAEGVAAGLTNLGENRLQGVPEKVEMVKRLAGAGLAERLTWHFIGHLQTNKVRSVLETFTLIHSLDRENLVDRVDRTAGELGIVAHGLIQVNVSGAESQGGVEPEALMKLAEIASNREFLRVHGLMAIGPNTDNADDIRRAFRSVRGLAAEVGATNLPGVTMEMLSMGMSNDYQIAVEEGATHVRIGTAIFGPRWT
ncbi:MAG: YggS family pyridoxal phosphate-dependent enzyme [bacterium]